MSSEHRDRLVPEDLEGALRAAFGGRRRDGVLPSIESRHGVRSRILLRSESGREAPLVRLAAPGEEPAAADDARYEIVGEIATGGVGVVLVESSKTVDETYSDLVDALDAADPINIAFELDHAANAATTTICGQASTDEAAGEPGQRTTITTAETASSVANVIPARSNDDHATDPNHLPSRGAC